MGLLLGVGGAVGVAGGVLGGWWLLGGRVLGGGPAGVLERPPVLVNLAGFLIKMFDIMILTRGRRASHRCA